jgi:hypothetical protein
MLIFSILYPFSFILFWYFQKKEKIIFSKQKLLSGTIFAPFLVHKNEFYQIPN